MGKAIILFLVILSLLTVKTAFQIATVEAARLACDPYPETGVITQTEVEYTLKGGVAVAVAGTYLPTEVNGVQVTILLDLVSFTDINNTTFRARWSDGTNWSGWSLALKPSAPTGFQIVP